MISLLYNRTLVCHDMQGGYIGDHWEDGCQVAKSKILIEKAQIMLICATLLRSGSSHKDQIEPGFYEVTVFLWDGNDLNRWRATTSGTGPILTHLSTSATTSWQSLLQVDKLIDGDKISFVLQAYSFFRRLILFFCRLILFFAGWVAAARRQGVQVLILRSVQKLINDHQQPSVRRK